MRSIRFLLLTALIGGSAALLFAGSAAGASVCSSATPQYCPAPTVKTGAASSVTTTSAVLNGTVNPNGAPTACVFAYGTTTKYGTVTSVQTFAAGTSTIPLSATINGLSPKTTYHFVLFCRNAGGPAIGADSSFTTSSLPAPKSKVSIATRKAFVSKKGIVKFVVPCNSSTTCKGKLSLTSPKGKSLAKSAKYTIAGHKRKTISLKLTKKALKQLKKAKHHREKAVVKAVDTDGSSAKRTVTLILKK